MDPDRLGLALWPSLASAVLEVFLKPLLLRIRRDHRPVTALVADHLGIQEPDRGLTVRNGGPLACLLVQLEAGASGLEQVRDQMGSDVVPEHLQLSGQGGVLREVHRTGDWDRPTAVGSTSAARSATNFGFFRAASVRLPPGRRMRLVPSRSPEWTSLSPREIVNRERPMARATRPIPP